MRIALWHDMPSGGGLRALDNHVRGLASTGHEVHIWTTPATTTLPSEALVASVHTVGLELPSQRSHWTMLKASWRGCRTDIEAYEEHSHHCAREIRSIEPDLVFAHPGATFRVPAIACHLPEVPSVLFLHEPHRALFEAQFNPPWVAPPAADRRIRFSTVREFVHERLVVDQSRILLRNEITWLAGFDDVLVNSLFSREAVLRAYGRECQPMRLGIDLDRFPAQPRPAELRGNVLCVGAMVIEKNPHFLVRAVAAAGPSVRRFVWIANYANPQLAAEVESMASALGLEFELRVDVTDQALIDAYRAADIFVYAPRLEPFGLAPLEANATGLPVVAVAEGGVRETIVDGVNGIVASPDPQSFGTVLAGLLNDAHRTRELGHAARAHVARAWPSEAAATALDERLRIVALAGSSAKTPSSE